MVKPRPSIQPNPSIQSFYQPGVPSGKAEAVPPTPSKIGDGFTEEELAGAIDPLSRKWNPEREYEEASIGQLVPGPLRVTFMGRIANLRTVIGNDAKQPKAAGWHYLIVKDDGGISIKLYFSQTPYPLKLGQLLSFWTSFVGDGTKADGGLVPGVGVSANVFPGRVTSDHVLIHTNASSDDICRLPLEYKKGEPLPGLMTLGAYLQGGHDGVNGVRLLVCVKCIGATRKIRKTDGSGRVYELADVWVFDHTGEVKMTVWSEMIESVREWKAGKTILLISNPGWKVGHGPHGKGNVGITKKTMLDVDPVFGDAEWLKQYAVGLTRKESVCGKFPDGVWDVDSAEYGVVRMLFTLAELDRWVRSDGSQVFTGFIDVTILDMSLVSLQRRNMLMCAECCGVPIFANALTIPCRNCEKPLRLNLNARIMGPLLDETGCIAPGKLLWSTRAWEDFFGRDVKDVVSMTGEECRKFETKCLALRMHLCVGWDGGGGEEGMGGRLGVLAVKM